MDPSFCKKWEFFKSLISRHFYLNNVLHFFFIPESIRAIDTAATSSIKSCVMSAALTTGTAEKVTFDPTQYTSSSLGTSYSCPH